MPFFRIPLLFALGHACDVSYDFGDVAESMATRMQVTLTWWQVTPLAHAEVYMSTATGTACNSGYFGAQFHSNGKTSLLFSMWDSPKHSNNSEFVFQSLPGSSRCKRNALDSSGKSTGTQCSPGIAGEETHLELGVPYVFTFGIVEQNASGAMWEVSMLDSKSKVTTSVGKIFFVDEPMGLPRHCRALGKAQDPPTPGLSSYTFLEYFAQPRDFLTVATWSGMEISGVQKASGGVEFEKIGSGACSAATQKAPAVLLRRNASRADCEESCSRSASCGAFSFCSGVNCAGQCTLFPMADYTAVKPHPTTECWAKAKLLRPKGIVAECCDVGDVKGGDRVNGSSSTCSPPGCESPAIQFYMGPHVLLPEKVMRENPTCRPPPAGGAGAPPAKRMADCWADGIPASLDECFARRRPAEAAIVV